MWAAARSGQRGLATVAIPRRGDKVTVAMSGGVDSSVVAALLAREDYDLRAVYMRNWSTLDERGSMQAGSGGAMGCDWQREWRDVQAVCRHLGRIPVDMIDLSQAYWLQVFEPALEQWTEGTTPNPDVECNRSIKFGALMDRILGPSLDGWLATGHYAQRTMYEGRTLLQRGRDPTKDQSFFLSSVPPSRLAHALFPLGSMHKTDVRALARTLQLPTADKDESMGLCFVGERGSGAHAFARFLDHYVISEPGDLVTPEGHVLGQHRGLHTLTIGQRARIPSLLERYYVAKKDPATRRITVVPGKTHPMLQCVALDTDTFAWHTPIPLLDTPLLAQVRYRQNAQPCIVQSRGSSGVRIAFEPSMQAVSPGQTVVVYDGQVCVGSGTIDRVYTEA